MADLSQMIGWLKRHPSEPETGCLSLDGQPVPYTVERSRKRKRTFSIALSSTGDVRVVVPYRASRYSIADILQSRSHWIAKKREEIRHRPSPLLPTRFHDGTKISFLGNAYNLRTTTDPTRPQGCTLTDGDFLVNLPDAPPEKERPHAAELEIMLWYKRQAKEILRERMDYWSGKLNLRYRRLIISSPTSRWGSCNRDNDIRLNWRVIMCAMPLIDYLIVHELCHIKHKDHSPRFWALVGTAIPDYKERRKELRRIR